MSNPFAAFNVSQPLVDNRDLPLGRKCLLKQLSVIVDTSEPESRRHCTGTPPSFTIVMGHLPTALFNTLSVSISSGEPVLTPPVARLLAAGGASFPASPWEALLWVLQLNGHLWVYFCILGQCDLDPHKNST